MIDHLIELDKRLARLEKFYNFVQSEECDLVRGILQTSYRAALKEVTHPDNPDNIINFCRGQMHLLQRLEVELDIDQVERQLRNLQLELEKAKKGK